MADKNKELKLCPFCGSAAGFDYYESCSLDSSFEYVGCTSDDCGVMIMDGTIEDWNKRISNGKSK